MTPVNTQKISIQDTYNFSVPCEGAKVIPLLLDFSADAEFDLDLQQFTQQSKITMIQSIYIDLSDTTNAMVVIIDPDGLKQTIVANGHTQGFYTVLAPNPPRIVFQCASGQAERVHLVNVPIAGVVWASTHP